jgi:hypothetical protein
MLAALTLLALIAVVSIGYPLANSGVYGPGGDVDDAMRIATTELILGHYPYYLKTYLGWPISPLPGAIFLAVPWAVSGLLQLQNVFWIGVLFGVLRQHFQKSAPALLLRVVIFAPLPDGPTWSYYRVRLYFQLDLYHCIHLV